MILFSGKLIAALIAEKNPAAPPPITIMSFFVTTDCKLNKVFDGIDSKMLFCARDASENHFCLPLQKYCSDSPTLMPLYQGRAQIISLIFNKGFKEITYFSVNFK
jgi:hypothetical protein